MRFVDVTLHSNRQKPQMDTSENRHNWALKYEHNDLFRPGDNVELNACVGKNGGPYNFSAYSRGYFEAGKRLVGSLVENQSLVDIIVYPVVYIYRHAIELGLKHLAYRLPPFFDKKEPIKLTHNLIDNWILVLEYLEQLPDGGNDPEPIQIVDKVLKDLVQLDPKGETFRFPQSRNEVLHLQDTSIINVEIFAVAMVKVYEAFQFWFDVVAILWETKSEALYDEQQELASISVDEMLWNGPD